MGVAKALHQAKARLTATVGLAFAMSRHVSSLLSAANPNTFL
jgi:hypothetical protein